MSYSHTAIPGFQHLIGSEARAACKKRHSRDPGGRCRHGLVPVSATSAQPEHGPYGQQKAQADQQKALAKAHGHGLNVKLLTDGSQGLLVSRCCWHTGLVEGEPEFLQGGVVRWGIAVIGGIELVLVPGTPPLKKHTGHGDPKAGTNAAYDPKQSLPHAYLVDGQRAQRED